MGRPTTAGSAQTRWQSSGSDSDRIRLVLAGFVTLVAAALAVVSYQRHPHVPDEVVYLLQASYFAAGRLTMPLPPVPMRLMST